MKTLGAVLLGMWALSGGRLAWCGEGASGQPVTLRIPAQPLDQALSVFAQQTGLQVIFRADQVGDRQNVRALAGRFTTDEALKRLLADSGLQYKYLNERTIAVTSKVKEIDVGARLDSADPTEIRLAQLQAAPGSPGQSPSSASDAAPEPSGQKPAAENQGAIPEVFVRGSRSLNMDIVRTVDDAQPYYILDKEQIERSGAVNVEGFLKQRLTMNTSPMALSQGFVGARGATSTINLRGIGATQTLILINGRRTAAVALTGNTSQPNLNGIPLAAVERIEVLPASSAAIYGGSAVGGVINVVLKSGYTGGQIKAVYDNTFDTNAAVRTVDAAYGLSFEEGRTHVLLSGHYSDGGTLLARDRPELLVRGINLAARNSPGFLYSATAPFLGATPNIASVDGSNLVLEGGTDLGFPNTFIPAGISPTTPRSVLNAGLLANAGSQNLTPPDTANSYGGNLMSLGAVPESKAFVSSLRREMTDALDVFAEFSYATNTGTWRSTPLLFPYTFRVAAGSPVNPFEHDVNITLVTPDTTSYVSHNTSKRATLGFILGLSANWMMEGDYTWNSNRLSYSSGTYLDAEFPFALAEGSLNPFVDQLASPLDFSNYVGDYHATNPSTVKDAGLRFRGPLYRLPAGDLNLVAGLGHRREGIGDTRLYFNYPNFPEANSERLYFAQSQTVSSLYLETNIPVVGQGSNIPGLRSLDFQAAVRTERYEVGSGTPFHWIVGPVSTNVPRVRFEKRYTSTNPTIGLRYKPIEDLMLRASFSRGFIVPTYSQLLPNVAGPTGDPVNVSDPRRGNELVSVQSISGGNAGLVPQESSNWNFGFVFQPEGLPGLRASVDWYRIEQEHIIITPTREFILANESSFPERVVRNAPAAGDPYEVGTMSAIDITLLNANRAETRGIDFSLDYRREFGRLGSFGIGALGTYVQSYKIQTAPGSPLMEIANEVNNSGPIGFKGNVSLDWARQGWNASWTAVYYGSYPQFDQNTTIYIDAQGSDRIPHQVYHDLFVGYRFKSGEGAPRASRFLSDVTLQAGIKNVFNEIPPTDVYYGRTRGYYYSPFGDPRLRSYWVSIGKEF